MSTLRETYWRSKLPWWRNVLRGGVAGLLNLLPDKVWLRLNSLRWEGLARREPARALQALLTADQELNRFIDQEAVRYGQGVHAKHRLTKYHDFFVRRIGPGEKVLDVGCGNGLVAYAVAEGAGAWVVAMDLDPDHLAQARGRFSHPRITYLWGDALTELPEGGFDVVILSNVLEHLPARPRFLQKLQAAARPSRLLIRVPLFEREWRVPLRRELGLEWRSDNTHETEYTLESFAQEMAAAGLKVDHLEVRWGEIWAEVSKS
ncbi:MAG: class I SAM-dependent methyltransferase [Thermodesulfobacteriota bacterium]